MEFLLWLYLLSIPLALLAIILEVRSNRNSGGTSVRELLFYLFLAVIPVTSTLLSLLVLLSLYDKLVYLPFLKAWDDKFVRLLNKKVFKS